MSDDAMSQLFRLEVDRCARMIANARGWQHWGRTAALGFAMASWVVAVCWGLLWPHVPLALGFLAVAWLLALLGCRDALRHARWAKGVEKEWTENLRDLALREIPEWARVQRSLNVRAIGLATPRTRPEAH